MALLRGIRFDTHRFDTDYNVLDKVRNYLIAQSQGQIINTEAKVIWFGNGEAGKTTLSHQFRENEFSEEVGIDRTHGILINEWRINYQDIPQNLKTKIETSIQKEKAKEDNPKLEIPIPEQITLKLWDFGGQEYYHATHRLFLSSNVMYLLVWDYETKDQNEELGVFPLGFWRENIKEYAEENIIIEVQNKVKGIYSVDHSKMKYKIEFRDETNPRSLQKYELDIEDLKEAIFSQLHHLDYLGNPFPKVYNDIREIIRQNSNPYLNFEDYKTLCQTHDFTQDKIMQSEGQIQTLTNFLHDTGAIICYHYKEGISKKLRDYVFLQPSWVTDYIYKILSEDLKSKGEFDFEHITNKTAESGIEAKLWVELMKEFELIFENKAKKTFIAPQYLPKDCINSTALSWALKSNPQTAFILHFPKFLSKSLFLRFIVKYGTENIDDLYWKNGLVFSLNNKVVYATCDFTERKITVQIQDKDLQSTQEIFESLISLSNRPETIELYSEEKKAFRSLQTIKNHPKEYQDEFWFVFDQKPNKPNKNMNNNINPNTNVLFNLLDDAFNDDGLRTFCFNYFPKVHNNFSEGQSKIAKIRALIEHCQQNLEMDKLLEKIRKERKAMYNKYESELFKDDSNSSNPNDNLELGKGSINTQPAIFTAFANPKGDLENLNKEQNGIQDLFLKLNSNGEFKHINRTDTDKKAYFKFLREYKNKIVFFHYGGHAGINSLGLSDGDISFQPLAKELFNRNSKSLRFVFLNGCATYAHMKVLQDLGVPIVLATSVPINDTSATEFALTFYENFIDGDDIQTAYESACNYVQATPQINTQNLGKKQRMSDLIEGVKTNNSVFPWGLYVLDESIKPEEITLEKLRGQGSQNMPNDNTSTINNQGATIGQQNINSTVDNKGANFSIQ